jgi:hypothetical protein
VSVVQTFHDPTACHRPKLHLSFKEQVYKVSIHVFMYHYAFLAGSCSCA